MFRNDENEEEHGDKDLPPYAWHRVAKFFSNRVRTYEFSKVFNRIDDKGRRCQLLGFNLLRLLIKNILVQFCLFVFSFWNDMSLSILVVFRTF